MSSMKPEKKRDILTLFKRMNMTQTGLHELHAELNKKSGLSPKDELARMKSDGKV